MAGTPNYYVQKLFSTHRGTQVIPALKEEKPLTGSDSLYASATIDKTNKKACIKLVNTSISVKPVRLNLDGLSFLKNGEIETLKADNLFDFNSIADPKLIYPSSRQVSVSSKKVSANIEPRSVNVIVLNYKK